MCYVLKHWWVHYNAHWEALTNRLPAPSSTSPWSCKTAARTMSGSPGTGGSNPRKFSEKIALHNQKQAEETRAFEQLMTDLTVSRVNTIHFQPIVICQWYFARMRFIAFYGQSSLFHTVWLLNEISEIQPVTLLLFYFFFSYVSFSYIHQEVTDRICHNHKVIT